MGNQILMRILCAIIQGACDVYVEFVITVWRLLLPSCCLERHELEQTTK